MRHAIDLSETIESATEVLKPAMLSLTPPRCSSKSWVFHSGGDADGRGYDPLWGLAA